jgi:hypothetical protein
MYPITRPEAAAGRAMVRWLAKTAYLGMPLRNSRTWKVPKNPTMPPVRGPPRMVAASKGAVATSMLVPPCMWITTLEATRPRTVQKASPRTSPVAPSPMPISGHNGLAHMATRAAAPTARKTAR